MAAWLPRVLPGRALFGLLLLALYWLYGFRPFQIDTELVVDDFLYVRQATGFLDWLQGRSLGWLGPFDCFLLVKAPLYGVWLGTLDLLGVPLRVGEFLLLLSGPFLLRRALRPLVRLRGWRFAAVVAMMVANPFLPGDFRLHREGLQIALANLCVVSSIGMCLRASGQRRQRLAWAVLAGLCFALGYLNREEAIWLLGAVLAALAIGVGRIAAMHGLRGGAWRIPLRELTWLAGAIVVGFLPPVLTVCTLNRMHYGVFLTSFRHSPTFGRLYNRLTSLEPAGHQAYVPINRATRMKAYALSPTFERLRPFLEARDSLWGAGHPAHSSANWRSPGDGEIFASTLDLSLLHAAEAAGARSASELEATFAAIDRELGQAIAAGRIAATAHCMPMCTALHPGDPWRILAAGWRSFSSLLAVAHVPYYWPTQAIATPAQLDAIAHLTNADVSVQPRTPLHFGTRAWVLGWINPLQRVLYPTAFLGLIGLLLLCRRAGLAARAPWLGPLLWCHAIPLVGLLVFCLGMAMVEVLCWKMLFLGSYNRMGFAPLSVFCSLVIVALPTLSPSKPLAAAFRWDDSSEGAGGPAS